MGEKMMTDVTDNVKNVMNAIRSLTYISKMYDLPYAVHSIQF